MDGALQVRPEPEQTGGLGDQLRAELLTPDGVREVAGTDDAYPLAPGLPGEVLQVAVPAASPGELGMYVQIRVEAHRPIILGREGSALKKLSTAARLSMENFLGELALLSAEPWLIRLRHSIITSSTFWASGVQCPC